MMCETGEHCVMRGGFRIIAQRFQRTRPITAFQSNGKDYVTKRRVLGKQRPMAVAPEHIQISGAFCPVFSVIPVTDLNVCKRLQGRTKPCFSAVVLKSDEHTAAAGFGTSVNSIADHALFGPDCIEIKRPDKITADTIIGFIITAEHLITAADGEHGNPVLNGGSDFFAFAALQVGKQDLLFEILSATDENEVAVRKVQTVADLTALHFRLDSPPGEPFLYTDDIPAIPVKV